MGVGVTLFPREDAIGPAAQIPGLHHLSEGMI